VHDDLVEARRQVAEAEVARLVRDRPLETLLPQAVEVDPGQGQGAGGGQHLPRHTGVLGGGRRADGGGAGGGGAGDGAEDPENGDRQKEAAAGKAHGFSL
jgi:hypothetical protein